MSFWRLICGRGMNSRNNDYFRFYEYVLKYLAIVRDVEIPVLTVYSKYDVWINSLYAMYKITTSKTHVGSTWRWNRVNITLD